ncbi:hypothetical protein CAPTEDRAFT_226920 [Capitella teleta]|uniref:G-protein coupled receptors family 1 profile domain-containing protein n=1 Tax=Capitella teleta TaxID=283909 RepID=R7U850_CAPTE|nr:hypothetical protein CAPTEDRAFT_226920 [Capitella teleta]|eukprot:ELT99826.1 hypothetical protein CAPTEDRAFT_226920 [Capitella teleta]
MSDQCSLFNFIVWGVIGGFICCFGFVGNLLSLVAFQRDRRSPTTTLLQCLAASDFILLLSVFITDALPYICDFTNNCANPWSVWPYIRYIWILTPTSHMCSIWFVVLIAFNRYWAVCRPHTMARVWHNKRTPFYVCAALFIVIGFNLPRFFEYQIQEEERLNEYNQTITVLVENKTTFGDAFSYKAVYKVMLVNILLIIVPICFLVVMTTLILRALRKTKRKLKQNKKSAAKQGNGTTPGRKRAQTTNTTRGSTSEITVVLVMVVVVAIVGQTPLALFHFVRYLFEFSCGDFVFYLDNISKLLVNINSCINFVIYCLFSRKFRKLLCTTFVCQAMTQVEPSTTVSEEIDAEGCKETHHHVYCHIKSSDSDMLD